MFLIFLLVLFFSSPQAWGADFTSARVDGLGGAGHAAPVLTEAIYMNPSYTSFMKTKALSGGFVLYNGQSIPKSYQAGSSSQDIGANLWNASVMDGMPDSLFQAGLGYTQRQDGKFINLGMSKGIVSGISVGTGAKMVVPRGAGSRTMDVSASASGVLTDWLQASLSVENIIESEEARDRGMFRDYILGTKVNIKSLLKVYFDPLLSPHYPIPGKNWGYSLGLEVPCFQDLNLRFGQFRNTPLPFQEERGQGYSLGLGWVGPKITVDYAFSRVLVPTYSSAHNFGLNVFF